VQNSSVAARRRRLPLTVASGSSQIAYHGKSQAVESSSASVVQPAATIQLAPRAARHRAPASTTTKPAMNRWRHQLGGWAGVPIPTSRAVSAGRLCVATSCCCSPTAARKPNVCTPKPSRPTIVRAIRLRTALVATPKRARVRGEASTRNGSTSPAVILTPTPATRVAAPARMRGFAPVDSASAPASSSRINVSLCAPPTASDSSTGLRPTKAIAQRAEWPRRAAVRAISATAPRLERTATAFSAHSPPASPSGTVA